MFRTLPADTLLYRATSLQFKPSRWRDAMSGQGTFHVRKGGRYNAPGFQVAYLATSPRAALAEWAYYTARGWLDETLPRHFVAPVAFPCQFPDGRLWCLRLTADTDVVDLDTAAARAAFGHYPLLLASTAQSYRATQEVAQAVLTYAAVGRPTPQAGVHAPAVRSRHPGGAAGDQAALFVQARPPAWALEQVWGLGTDFRDENGAAVQPATTRVAWDQAIMTVSGPHLPPPAPADPVGLVCGQPTTVAVCHT